ncbi:hypothetical protein D3C75_1286640 [compost metagenome]
MRFLTIVRIKLGCNQDCQAVMANILKPNSLVKTIRADFTIAHRQMALAAAGIPLAGLHLLPSLIAQGKLD